MLVYGSAGPMSALGQKQTSRGVRRMSAKYLRTDTALYLPLNALWCGYQRPPRRISLTITSNSTAPMVAAMIAATMPAPR